MALLGLGSSEDLSILLIKSAPGAYHLYDIDKLVNLQLVIRVVATIFQMGLFLNKEPAVLQISHTKRWLIKL